MDSKVDTKMSLEANAGSLSYFCASMPVVRALTAFEALYPGQRVVLEIENPDKAPEGSPERRRLSFYQNNGFVSVSYISLYHCLREAATGRQPDFYQNNGFSVMNTGIRLFDVPMKLLVRNGSVTYEDYKAFKPLDDSVAALARSQVLQKLGLES